MCFFFSSSYSHFPIVLLTFWNHHLRLDNICTGNPLFPSFLFSTFRLLSFRPPLLPSPVPHTSPVIFPQLLTTSRAPTRLGGECQCEAAFTSNLVLQRKHCTSFLLSPSPLCFCCCRISVRKICITSAATKADTGWAFHYAANYVFQQSNKNLKTLDTAQSVLLR